MQYLLLPATLGLAFPIPCPAPRAFQAFCISGGVLSVAAEHCGGFSSHVHATFGHVRHIPDDELAIHPHSGELLHAATVTLENRNAGNGVLVTALHSRIEVLLCGAAAAVHVPELVQGADFAFALFLLASIHRTWNGTAG